MNMHLAKLLVCGFRKGRVVKTRVKPLNSVAGHNIRRKRKGGFLGKYERERKRPAAIIIHEFSKCCGSLGIDVYVEKFKLSN